MISRMVKRGEIYFVDFGIVVGSEQGGIRPALIIQNDTGNRYSPTTIVAPITSILQKKKIPTHVPLTVGTGHTLEKNSVILLEQVRTVDKKRLRDKHGFADIETMILVDTAIQVSLGTIQK